MYDTKIAIVLRNNLASWQKLNVTAFLVRHRRTISRCDRRAIPRSKRQPHNRLSVQPMIVLSDDVTIAAIHRRALERDVTSSSSRTCLQPAMTPPIATSLHNFHQRTPASSALRSPPRKKIVDKITRAPSCTHDPTSP